MDVQTAPISTATEIVTALLAQPITATLMVIVTLSTILLVLALVYRLIGSPSIGPLKGKQDSVALDCVAVIVRKELTKIELQATAKDDARRATRAAVDRCTDMLYQCEADIVDNDTAFEVILTGKVRLYLMSECMMMYEKNGIDKLSPGEYRDYIQDNYLRVMDGVISIISKLWLRDDITWREVHAQMEAAKVQEDVYTVFADLIERYRKLAVDKYTACDTIEADIKAIIQTVKAKGCLPDGCLD